MDDTTLELDALVFSPGRRMEQVVSAIRAAVDSGRMKPDVKYSVYQLADKLGVSRTPVRDALLRLEEAGLVRFEARQGFYVQLPHPREIADIFAVRLALELPAVRRAATLATVEDISVLDSRMKLMRSAIDGNDESTFAHHDLLLHDHILGVAGNERSRKIVATLRDTTRLLGATTADRSRPLSDIDAEHLPVIAAITDGDPARAYAAMRAHILTTGRLLVDQAARAQHLELDVESIWRDAIAGDTLEISGSRR